MINISFALVLNKATEFSNLIQTFEQFFDLRTTIINKKNANCSNNDKRFFVDITSNKIHFIFSSSMNESTMNNLFDQINSFIRLYLSNYTIGVKWYKSQSKECTEKVKLNSNMHFI